MVLRRTVALFSLALAHSGIVRAADPDVVIYGGTAAAITAAVQVVQMGRTVVIVRPDEHPGLSELGL